MFVSVCIKCCGIGCLSANTVDMAYFADAHVTVLTAHCCKANLSLCCCQFSIFLAIQ